MEKADSVTFVLDHVEHHGAAGCGGMYELPYGTGKSHWADASPLAKVVLGGWQIGTLFNARTGLPVDVEIARPDIAYRDTTTGAISAAPVVSSSGVMMTVPVVNVP